jgi:hypothetical protein
MAENEALNNKNGNYRSSQNIIVDTVKEAVKY